VPETPDHYDRDSAQKRTLVSCPPERIYEFTP
jgi:hypothetical protein